VRRSPLTDLLSHWGSAFFFWTWKRQASGMDLQPAYGPAPALASARGHLKAVLDHLPWLDTADPEEPAINGIRPKAAGPSPIVGGGI